MLIYEKFKCNFSIRLCFVEQSTLENYIFLLKYHDYNPVQNLIYVSAYNSISDILSLVVVECEEQKKYPLSVQALQIFLLIFSWLLNRINRLDDKFFCLTVLLRIPKIFNLIRFDFLPSFFFVYGIIFPIPVETKHQS